MMDDVAMVG